MRRALVGLAVACVVSTSGASTGCGSTGTKSFQYPAIATGQASLPIETDAYTATITSASLAYGPAYFCQTAASSPELCPVAQAEIVTVATIDLLNPNPQSLGDVDSLAGAIGTTTYDLGWSWFPRDQKPRRAPGLDHSASFELTLVRKADGATRNFIVGVDLLPTIAGTRTVGATRVSANIEDPAWTLHVSGDARVWWTAVDFAELDALPEGTMLVPDTTRAAATIRQQITSGHPLQFAWERQ